MKSIRALALSRVKNNKSRSFLVCIALLLTTMLLMTIGSLGYGIVQHQGMTVSETAGNHHASYNNITAQQLDTLSKHVYVEALSYTEIFADVIKDKQNMSLLNTQVVKEGVEATPLTAGRMPEAEDEIAGPPSFFERADSHPALGETVTLSYRVYGERESVTKDFIITGLQEQVDLSALNLSDARLAFTAVISGDLADRTMQDTGLERRYSAKVRVLGEGELNYDEMLARLNEIAQDVGLEEGSLSENGNYLAWKISPGADALSLIIAAGAVIVLFAGLIIYSIYYVAIITNIQELGKLKALGATKRQMRSLLLCEGLISAAISIPPGLLLGYGIARLAMIPLVNLRGGSVSPSAVPVFSPAIMAIVILVVVTTVVISLLRPSRLAAKISPMEAIRYQAAGAGKKARRAGYDKVTLPRLCISNLKRNSRRTAITIATMSLGGVLFLTAGTLLSSMDRMDMARLTLPRGQFLVNMIYSYEDATYPENELNHLQAAGAMSPAFVQSIESIPGVSAVEEDQVVLAAIDHPAYENGERVSVSAATPETLEAAEYDLRKGSLDYDLLSQGGIIHTWDDSFEQKGLSIGDSIHLELLDGDARIPMDATITATLSTGNSDFIMSKERMDELIQTNTTAGLFVHCEDADYETVKANLESIVSETPHLSLVTLDEELGIADLSMSSIKISIYFILILLGLISFVNLINTMITSIITRRRELGVLQALGMSDKQLGRMLFQEGLVFTGGTLALSLSLGNVLGYLAYLWARANGLLGIVHYHYPWRETLIISAALLLGQVGVTYFISRHAFKDSLSQRMRYE